MKKLLKFFVSILIAPALILCGCKSNLPAIDTKTYLKPTVTTNSYGITSTSTIDLSVLTAKKANKDKVSKFTKFSIDAEPTWIYKMFVQKIVFYVYTSEASTYQMTVTLSMNNLAEESVLKTSSSETTLDTETIKKECSFTPTKNGSFKCEYTIEKAVATATGSSITIDILNSPELFTGEKNTFSWIIYGFNIYGESRAYSS